MGLTAAGMLAMLAVFRAPRGRAGAEPQPSRILVEPFANRTGTGDLDHLGALAADYVTAGLTLTGVVDFVARTSGEPGPTRGARQNLEPEDMSIGTVVSGGYALSGDSVRFNAFLTDQRTGAVVAAVESSPASITDVTPALETLRDGVMAAAGAHVDPRLAQWSRHASRPPTLEAYLLFAQGLEEAVQVGVGGGHLERALDLFERASNLDTTFTMAGLWAALEVGDRSWTGPEGQRVRDRQREDSILGSLNARRAALAEVDRHFLDFLMATSQGGRFRGENDLQAGLRAIRRLLEVPPGSDYVGLGVYVALRAQRPREALELARGASVGNGWLSRWRPFWRQWAMAAYAIDRCDEIPAIAERARAVFPGEAIGPELELLAYSCLGDTDRLMEVATAYATDSERHQWSGPESASTQLARAAMRLVGRTGSRPENAPFIQMVTTRLAERVEHDAQARNFLPEILAEEGRLDSARVIVERFRADPAYVAVFDLAQGRTDRVDSLIAVLQERTKVADDVGFALASVYAHLGDMERAREAYRKALDATDTRWIGLGDTRPFLVAPLAADPEIRRMVAPRG